MLSGCASSCAPSLNGIELSCYIANKRIFESLVLRLPPASNYLFFCVKPDGILNKWSLLLIRLWWRIQILLPHK